MATWPFGNLIKIDNLICIYSELVVQLIIKSEFDNDLMFKKDSVSIPVECCFRDSTRLSCFQS